MVAKDGFFFELFNGFYRGTLALSRFIEQIGL